jgi:carboxymethylenebutenolidase
MSYTSVTLPSGETFQAYVAKPSHLPAPAVVVIQEIFGVNEGIREKCDWLAENGFIAIAPDLFWRLEPGVQLTDKTQAEWDKAFYLMNRFDIDRGISDIQTTINYMRQDNNCTGRVACLGYCLGGKVAYLTACKTDIDASVGYYGVGIENLLDESVNIKNPLMLHIAGEDKFVPRKAQDKIIDGLKDIHHIITHRHENVDHAFTRKGGDHYDAAKAALADAQTIEFLQSNLQSPHTHEKAS